MKPTTVIGKEKEALAEVFLSKKGYTSKVKNYRYRKGEIDLITLHDEILVFVEVKYRKNSRFGFPEASVTETKAELIRQTAEQYMQENNWHGRIRFDIVSICGNEVLHLEDAF